jgi:hypothetical protein
MLPEITIEEIDKDSVVVEGQRIERKTCSPSHWLSFWLAAKNSKRGFYEAGYEDGYRDGNNNQRKYAGYRS